MQVKKQGTKRGQNEQTGAATARASPEEFRQDTRVITATGYSFLEAGRPELALEVLSTGPIRKRKMDPELLTFRYTLGRIYMATGDKKRAIRELRKVYVEDMEYEKVAELLAELEGE